ncbi:MAG: FxsA family protein [Halanaerobiales bacterium]
MFIKLLLLFTVVPAVELALLIKIGQYVGVLATIILVASTGIIGVSLARSQGFIIIRKIKSNLNEGKMPTDDLIGGLLILIGGTMLLTPGLLTDITGFSLILPGTRHFFAQIVKRRFSKYFTKNGFNINSDYGSSNRYHNTDDDYIDIDSDEVK